jgi:hypothetical protein
LTLDKFVEDVFDSVTSFVRQSLEPIARRFAELEAKIAAIPAGKDGANGRDGKDGADGKNGADGKDGAHGKDGANGLNGKDGANGRDGERGIRGEKGDPGANGKDGLRGEKGLDGIGKDGANGKDGLPGKDGRDGREGKDGLNGKDGAPGRDALEIDILPAIEEQKSYPRGTFARHAGGLWRAVSDTQAMRGWECIVAGVASLTVELENERTLIVTTALTGAEPVAKRVPLLHPIDRGVYRPEEKYLKGDGVTWAGSWWLAQVNEPTDKPGISDQWRLAVKRGRDGKDGK